MKYNFPADRSGLNRVASALIAVLMLASIFSVAAYGQKKTRSTDLSPRPMAPSAIAFVTNTNDSGAGSLRQAIIAASPGDLILFDTFGVFASTQTITLTSGPITVNKILTIIGPGSNKLTISGNNTSRIFNVSSDLVLFSVKLSNANATGAIGGAMRITGGTTSIFDSVISNNSASGGAGIAVIGSTITIGRTAITNNASNDAPGLYVQDGVANVQNSTFSGNAGGPSGAIVVNALSAGATVNLVNSTISGNTSSTGTSALQVTSNAPFTAATTLVNCTVTNNSSPSANPSAAVDSSIGTGTNNLSLTNTIVSGNTEGGGPDDIAGTVNPASSYNLVGVGGGLVNGVNNNIVGVNNPQLAPLAVFGGTTATHVPLNGSPVKDQGSAAINPINSAPLTSDQNGNTRPADDAGIINAPGGDGSDIGAVEAPVPTAANVVISGHVYVGMAGLARATVVLTDSNGNSRSVRTNSFGAFSFDDVEVGQSYVVSVTGTRFRFAPQILAVENEISELEFRADF